MEQSILKSTKKVLGVGPDDVSFDLDITTYINSAFSTLTDLGVGPVGGFAIEDQGAVWADFLANDLIKLSKIKTCVFLRVKLLFDPPTSAYLLDAAKEQLREQEWRLNTNREATAWVDPNPPVTETPDTPPILDGGGI